MTDFSKYNKFNVKSPATIKQQLDKLKSRGCIIADEKKAEETLSFINYYRLAHYFEPFLLDKYHYKEGTTFEKIVQIYDFDRKLRILILSVLEEIEIALRAVISNSHSMRYGALGYLNAENFNTHHNHQYFLSKIERMIETNDDKAFVKHHMKKYKGAFPLWVMMEMFSFGNLIYFFYDMHSSDKKPIADNYYKAKLSHVENWLGCISDLRNHCAHYNRLYANKIGDIPASDERWENTADSMLFSYLLAAKRLYLRKDRWNSNFVIPLSSLIESQKDILDISLLGFPDDWEIKLVFYNY
ncbi:MAG: Abi family protein [Clostridiales bacterium]|nr:Abi family protein [Clostridiales bacterium]